MARAKARQADHPPTSRFLANGQALRQVLAGFGIVLQPGAAAGRGRARRSADAHPGSTPFAARPVTLLYPKDRQALPKLTTFVEFVVARFTGKTGRR